MMNKEEQRYQQRLDCVLGDTLVCEREEWTVRLGEHRITCFQGNETGRLEALRSAQVYVGSEVVLMKVKVYAAVLTD